MHSRRLGTAAALLLLASTSLYGQEKEPPTTDSKPAAQGAPERPAAPKDAAQSVPSPEQTAPSGGFMAAMGHDGMVSRRMAGLLRLQSEMHEKLNLTAEQRKRIDQMYDDYFIGLMKPDQKPHAIPPEDKMVPPQQLPKLQKELEAARQSGDQAAIADVQERINGARAVLEPSVIDPLTFFLNYVAAELTPEQLEVFGKILPRWRALTVRELLPDDPFKRLTRSIRNPELDIPQELRIELVKELGKVFRNLDQKDRANPEKIAASAAEWQGKVFEQLTPEQRDHVKKTIETLERWSKEDEEAVAATRKRLAELKSKPEQPEARPKVVEPKPTP